MHGSIEKWFSWLKCDGVGYEGSVATSFIQKFKYNSNQTNLLMNKSKTLPENERSWSNHFINKLNKMFDDVQSARTIRKEKMNENNVGICDWDFKVEDYVVGTYFVSVVSIKYKSDKKTFRF